MILTILQIIVCLFLIGAIVLQMQGGGLSNAFGSGAQFYRSKRSIEKLLIWVTVILTIFFAFLSIALLFPH